jgi:small neutral amino acid transporter SnatA (MarC family)
MSSVLAAVGFFALLSGSRLRTLLDGPRERRILGIGAGVGALVALLLLVLGRPLIDFLEVSPPTFWVASGIVMTAFGLLAVARGPGKPWELGNGFRATLVPVAFPILITPALVMHALASGLDASGGMVMAVLVAAAVAVLVGTSSLQRRVAAALVRVEGALVVLLGVVWLVEGSRGLLL